MRFLGSQHRESYISLKESSAKAYATLLSLNEFTIGKNSGRTPKMVVPTLNPCLVNPTPSPTPTIAPSPTPILVPTVQPTPEKVNLL